jgi:iron complex transport system permease protein
MTTLILAGVAISTFTGALTSFLMLRSEDELRRAIAWLLGGSPAAGWEPVIAVAPYLLTGMSGLLIAGHALNVLQFGEDQAVQLGLPVNRAKNLVIVTASLTTAAAVAFSGIIGFIGLVVPHVVRLVWGEDYRRLIPLSMLGGATALLLSDVTARVVMAPQTLPVGIVTALVGAPFFIWMLRRRRRQVYW